jgi:hypothetical protein
MSNMDELRYRAVKASLFYPIAEAPVRVGDAVMPGKKGLLNGNTGCPIGIVSTKYKVATNEEVFGRFFEALDASGLNTEGAHIRTLIAHGGARVRAEFVFPGRSAAVTVGDVVDLRIVTKNSFDGRWKFSIEGGGLRLACSNGMKAPFGLGSYSEFHNGNLDVKRAAATIVGIVEDFDAYGAAWRVLDRTPITEGNAFRVFALYAGRQDDFQAGLDAYNQVKLGKARVNEAVRLMDEWTVRERVELGTTAYSVLNRLTAHATHAPLKAETAAIGRELRESRVREVTESGWWRDEVMAATTTH